MTERDSTDLPEPDSPTMPSVRPRSRLNDTPLTALSRPLGVRNCVTMSRTSSRVLAPGIPLGLGPSMSSCGLTGPTPGRQIVG
jgi:hypothetical protein